LVPSTNLPAYITRYQDGRLSEYLSMSTNNQQRTELLETYFPISQHTTTYLHGMSADTIFSERDQGNPSQSVLP